jgi:putative SOS response-associated peptidase YedK
MSGKRPQPGSSPTPITLVDRGLMALAGLWENWRSSAGEWVRSFAVVTTGPNAFVRPASQPDAGGFRA